MGVGLGAARLGRYGRVNAGKDGAEERDNWQSGVLASHSGWLSAGAAPDAAAMGVFELSKLQRPLHPLCGWNE